MELIKFAGVVCFSYLFVVNEPIEWVKDKLFITGMLRRLLDCALCSGFWIGFIMYGDVFIASLVSVFAELTYRMFNK